jgi:Zn-dependent peptidase ImmA (M78 family)
MPPNFALRRARKGTGVLPPNPTRWEQEHNALDVRHELSLGLDVQLPHAAPFGLLRDVYVCSNKELRLEPHQICYFSGQNSRKWSGMCIPYPNGTTLVLYNGDHPERRVRATLMEEFFHLWLGHRPDRLRLLSSGEGSRDFDPTKESDAYGSGAAALVPYKSLRAMLSQGYSVNQIADHFLVSEQMIQFRIRVSKLIRLRRRA